METVVVENIVIGAGVIGLSIAAELSRQGHEVYVLERDLQIGSGISSRNSEVVHSGVYYPKDSKKAEFCVRGRKKLYDYCLRYNIPHKKCGKLIVATSDAEIDKLEKIYEAGCNNGVDQIVFLNQREVLKREPKIYAVSSLYIPETGIIDSHIYMLSLAREIEEAGGGILLGHAVVEGEIKSNNFNLLVRAKSGLFQLQAKRLVVACGLFSHHICANLAGYELLKIPKLLLAKGSYFSYSGKEKFNHLIYPLPVPGGLGTHLTFDLEGNIRFGPDVEWLSYNDPSLIDYRVDVSRIDLFYNSIKRYWPNISILSLQPSYSGVRPKLHDEMGAGADFLIDMPENHQICGLAVLFGIESPGLTSSLEIGKVVARSII